MKLLLEVGGEFDADFEQQYQWYLREAGEEVAARFFRSIAETLPLLATHPDAGSRRKFKHPKLQNLRSFSARRPFQNILIFYKVEGNILQAWRLMHGSRDLPRRLIESPGA
jgi:plasmid stabilization system protein ParE